MAGARRLLVLSNGHGEDAIGAGIARRVQELGGGRLAVAAFPLVGTGEAYRAAGVPVVGPHGEPPTGGFAYLSPGHVVRDLAGGWAALVARQLAFAWRHRGEFDGIVGVGDRVSLELDRLVFRKPMVWVCVAYTARPLPPGVPLGRPSWWRAMRRWCTDVFTRDPETAASFRSVGVHAEWVGNPMMDGVVGPPEAVQRVQRALRAAGWDGHKAVVALLPGSRRDAVLNLQDQLEAVRRLDELTGGGVQPVVAWAPGLGVEALRQAAGAAGWKVKDLEPEGTGEGYVLQPDGAGDRRPLVAALPGQFVGIAHVCSLVIGQAGTAVEQAAGLGKPVVAFQSRGTQVARRFLRGQKEVLGDAVAIVEPRPEAVARQAAAILASPELYRSMSEAGRRLMGPPGATEAIARRVVERFAGPIPSP